MMPASSKLRYLLWAGAHLPFADTRCPACSQARTERVRRKYLVTALYRCPSCDVMFRVPKPSAEREEEFYQNEYEQGFTTDCPNPEELAKLKESCFAGTEKDYSVYIAVLRAIGLEPGGSIFDFGCSWGYGSWQLARAGYRVRSWEVSRPRARYAGEKLECQLCPPEELPEKQDCFFSAHVIEHLTNPRTMWEMARKTVWPGGKMVTFLPNGNPALDSRNPNYHQLWGQVHPLLLSPSALTRMGELHGFTVRSHTSPYNLREVGEESEGDLAGDELLIVGTLRG